MTVAVTNLGSANHLSPPNQVPPNFVGQDVKRLGGMEAQVVKGFGGRDAEQAAAHVRPGKQDKKGIICFEKRFVNHVLGIRSGADHVRDVAVQGWPHVVDQLLELSVSEG